MKQSDKILEQTKYRVVLLCIPLLVMFESGIISWFTEPKLYFYIFTYLISSSVLIINYIIILLSDYRRQSKIIYCSTPNGRNFWYEKFKSEEIQK